MPKIPFEAFEFFFYLGAQIWLTFTQKRDRSTGLQKITPSLSSGNARNTLNNAVNDFPLAALLRALSALPN